jgi:hypothetical protein
MECRVVLADSARAVPRASISESSNKRHSAVWNGSIKCSIASTHSIAAPRRSAISYMENRVGSTASSLRSMKNGAWFGYCTFVVLHARRCGPGTWRGLARNYPNSTERASFTAGFSRNCCSTRSGTTSSVETTATASSGSPGAPGASRRPSEKFAMLM